MTTSVCTLRNSSPTLKPLQRSRSSFSTDVPTTQLEWTPPRSSGSRSARLWRDATSSLSSTLPTKDSPLETRMLMLGPSATLLIRDSRWSSRSRLPRTSDFTVSIHMYHQFIVFLSRWACRKPYYCCQQPRSHRRLPVPNVSGHPCQLVQPTSSRSPYRSQGSDHPSSPWAVEPMHPSHVFSHQGDESCASG